MLRLLCSVVVLGYAVILCGDFNFLKASAEFFGYGHGQGFGHHRVGYGHGGFGLHFPHFINYTAVFEIKCIKKGGVCTFIDDCDIEMNVYFKSCGYNKSVVCCVPREVICKLSYGICSEDREGCTSAGFFWSWFQCNETHRCCRPHKFKKKKKKKDFGYKHDDGYGHGGYHDDDHHDDHYGGYGHKKKPKKKMKKKSKGYGHSSYGGYGDHHGYDHGGGYEDDHHGGGYENDHHDSGYGHDYHDNGYDEHHDDDHGGGYGGFLDFIKK